MYNTYLLLCAKKNEFKIKQLDFRFKMDACWRLVICPLLIFHENLLENEQVLFLLFLIVAVLISRIKEDPMLDSGNIFTNYHVSGVA